MDTNDTEISEGIAIIGMSGRFPGAGSVEEFWTNLVNGVESISRFDEEQTEYSVLSDKAKARGEKAVRARGVLDNVDMFDAAFFGIYPKEAEIMDPQHRIFLECAWESIESAGYDPQSYPGLIGVYAGLSLNTYLLHNLCGDDSFAAKLAGNYQIGEYQAMLGNDKDFLPTRVSYKLNLRGPSMAIQTACSSSLVAVSQACSSLLNYQADMALAGGVSITFPQRRDYRYEEGGMASVDGTCRTFDAEAKGTVFGHGSAVVLLKRLSEAMDDGDNILAVIKGSAVNNDGSEKIGYAAPSVNAQAEVIAMAQAAADVSPDSISYIEAHGTGTPLGDPIEIAALTKAFREGGATGNSYCSIGTGKPNISHLDVASGATGLIKTVLQLQHGEIPPLLNYRTPNPNINFTQTPFAPVTKRLPWPRTDTPRRAGVSAFGVGGTNVHAVIEEAPHRPRSIQSQTSQLFPLSAKSENALSKMRKNLATRLQADPNLCLADVAFTLQTGRQAFEYRNVTVATCREDLIAQLSEKPSPTTCGQTREAPDGVVFLFPGQGAQYVGMGRELYDGEPVFRAEIDRCAEILQREIGRDIRTVLYPTDETNRDAAETAINETKITQPAIFTVEYALAKLWISRGIHPAAVIGHSIGEYVCAVLAGTFSLENALKLLSIRAKLMQSLPGGAMMGVRHSATDIEPMLPEEVSIAAVNSPQLCTVTGPTLLLEQFETELQSKSIPCRMLATSHAFHSSMMDPILEEFSDASEKIRCSESGVDPNPGIRWISSCTGREMTREDVADAGYWSRQLRQPVLFSDALSTLLDSTNNMVLLEVGPGRALTQSAYQNPIKVPDGRIVTSIERPDVDSGDAMLLALGNLWCAGVALDWQTLHTNQEHRRVSLPTYPFERKSFWIDRSSSKPTHRDDAAQLGPEMALGLAERRDPPGASPEGLRPAANSEGAELDLVRSQLSTKERIAKELKSIFLDLSGMQVDDEDASFMSLGLDSLFLTQASQAIALRFGVKVTFRQLLGDLSTIALIADFLEPQIPDGLFTEDLPQAAPESPEWSGALTSQLNMAATGDVDVETMLEGHLNSIKGLLDHHRRQPRAGSANGLRRVKKPSSTDIPTSSDGLESNKTKRFGPFKAIDTDSSGSLTEQQQASLARLVDRYVKKTRSSKEYTARHRPHFADPRAVSGFQSQWKEMVYPIVSERSKGSRIWDIDGNEYVDITMGFGTYFFGHSPDWLVSALEKQLRTGIEIGPQSAMAGEVAKSLSELTGLDRVTFCNTGSEAVMAAMRLARTVTGRDRIVYFSGDYHGMFEEVLVRGVWPKGEYRAQPISPGIPPSLVENILVLEYGSPESLQIIKEHADEIAAVMVEPVQSRNPSLQPREFLHELRSITRETGSALIFDEVVTGFRCHPSGAQGYFGVQADMATYGKVIGGGIPIGVLAGSTQYMDALDGGMWQYGDDSFPEVGVTFFAGTFVRHPLAIAAAHAVLIFLKEAGPDLQSNMTDRVTRVVETINRSMETKRVPIRMSNFSAVAAIDYPSELQYGSLLWFYLREKGIHIWEGRPCYFTIAHTDEDLDRFINAFNESVDEMRSDGFLPEADSAITVNGSEDQFPLAEGQREMWLGAQMSPNAAGPHHACNAFVLDGPLNLKAMKKAIDMVVDRHEGLRCIFDPNGTKIVIQPNFALEVPLVDLTGLTKSQQQQRVQEIMDEEGRRLFDLSTGPLIAAQILKLSDSQHRLVFTAQMIVCDGWSHYVVFEEISEIYSAIHEGRSPRLNDVVPMRSYAQWQKDYWESPEAKRCEDHWLSKFETVPPPLNLPTKGTRPSERTVDADRVELLLSKEFYENIKEFGIAKQSSSFSVLLSAFQVWLHRLSGTRDMVVGVPFSEQGTLGFDTLVGQCANTLPIRATLHPDESFEDLLARTWNSLLDAQENPHYTFGKLIPHLDLPNDPSQIPLVSVLFNIDPAMNKVNFADLNHRFIAGPRVYYQFDLGFNLVEQDKGLLIECDFNTNLFDRDAVQQWLSSYDLVLRSIVTDAKRSISRIAMVEDNQCESLTCATTEPNASLTVHQLFEDQAKRTPEATAVRDRTRTLSYRELDKAANQLANRIHQAYPQSQKRIGLLADRTSELLIGWLAILKSGGCIVPIDPSLSQELISNVINDAGLTALLTHDALQDQLIGIELPVISLDHSTPESDCCPLSDIDVGPEHLASVFHSSSQTNRLTSKALTHQVIVDLLIAMQREPGIDGSDMVLGLSSPMTDVAALEWLLPLTVGAQCVIAPLETATDSRLLSEYLASEGITLLQATPTVLRRLIRHGWQGDAQLKILVGGEAVSQQLTERLHDHCSELWLMHGQSENTIWASAKRLHSGTKMMLGAPIAHTTLRVADEYGQPVATGVPGELLIADRGVEPCETNDRFSRTGEYARRLPSGDWELIGNQDSIVKVQGHRFCINDIESAIRSNVSVSDTAVVLRDYHTGKPGLVAYIELIESLSSNQEKVDLTRQLRQFIRGRLPAYMQPKHFIFLQEIPTTFDAKLDRVSLPIPSEVNTTSIDTLAAPQTPTQSKLVSIWRDILNVAEVGIDDRFFDLGGQSLLAVKLFARIEDEFGRRLPLATLFQAPTVEQLSSILDANTDSKSGWSSLVPIQPHGNKKPLFLVHGAGGNVLLYQALAKHLSTDYPLYGLQSQGLDGESEPLTTIEAMAERYLREVRAVQPEGPYCLGGYCLGGTVAYEMAQSLLRQGEEVAVVAMLDTYNFSRALKSSFLGFLTQKIRFHAGNFIRLRPRHMLSYLKEKIRVARDGELANLMTSRPGFDVEEEAGRATSGAELTVQTINDNAAETYLPQQYPGALTLLKPRINYKFYPDPKMGWGDLAMGGIEMVEFPFNPHAMLVEPYVQQLAASLIRIMDSANSGGNAQTLQSKDPT